MLCNLGFYNWEPVVYSFLKTQKGISLNGNDIQYLELSNKIPLLISRVIHLLKKG